MRTKHSESLRERAEFADELDRLINSYPNLDIETVMSDAEAVMAGRRSAPSDAEILILENDAP